MKEKEKNKTKVLHEEDHSTHRFHQQTYQNKRGKKPHSSGYASQSKVLDTTISRRVDNIHKTDTRSEVRFGNYSSAYANSVVKLRNSISLSAKTQHVLVTKNNTLGAKSSVAARTKDLRLKGSDLYVARLGSCQALQSKVTSKLAKTVAQLSHQTVPTEPTSLHDELSIVSRFAAASTKCHLPVNDQLPEVRESRPCYRCVTAMHSVGIKRVFWTNQDGNWEGAKVRDLVDALELGIDDENDGIGTGQKSKGVFVTKHEVLKLKRMMDAEG